MTVTLYSKPRCIQCDATKRALDAAGLTYEVVDLTQDVNALTKVSDMGYRSAPVVMAGDQHWSGFRPELISALA